MVHAPSGSPTGQNANYGIMMPYYDESIDDYNAVYSADYSDETKRPAMTITYQPSSNSIDGVCFIKYGSLCLSVDQGMIPGSTLTLQAKKSGGPAQLRQLWKIETVGQNLYSIRSMYRPDLALHANDNGTVDMATLDTAVSGSSVPSNKRWGISQEGSTYSFKFAGTAAMTMQPKAGALSPGIKVIAGVATNPLQNWTLEPASVSNQVLLINTEVGLPAHNAQRYIAPGETLTLNKMNLTASFVSLSTNAQNIKWIGEPDDTSILTVNESTGAITGVSAGVTTVTARVRLDNGAVYYSEPYTVNVLVHPEGTYFIKNKQTGRYLSIDSQDVSENATIYDLEFNGGNSQKWVFERLDDGTYSIKSASSSTTAYYLGVKGNSELENAEIVLRSNSATSGTHWYIEKTDRGTYKFIPATGISANRVMAVPSNGHLLQQLTYSNNSDHRDEWIIYSKSPTYYATVNNRYDYGYPVYYRESAAQGASKIDTYMQVVAMRYMELFGLDITAPGATYYSSSTDVCKGTISLNTIDAICTHFPSHTNRDTLLAEIVINTSGSNTISSVFWTGHKITSISDAGGDEENRSVSFNQYVLMLERSSVTDRYINSTGVLMYELNHQFGAPDHYHELTDPNNKNSCKHKDICSECGANKRPKSCIMKSSRIDISADTVICNACKQDILEHLRKHHEI